MRLHARKNRIYAERVRNGVIALRPGVRRLILEAVRAGCRQVVVTTTSRDNCEALLAACAGPELAACFEFFVCGEDVQQKKPDPQVYKLALDRLGLAPSRALALEDSWASLAAASAARLACLVTLSAYSDRGRIRAAEPPALAVVEDLDRVPGPYPAPVELAWRDSAPDPPSGMPNAFTAD